MRASSPARPSRPVRIPFGATGVAINYGSYRMRATRLRRMAHRKVMAVLAERAQNAIRAIWQMNLISRAVSQMVATEALVRRRANLFGRSMSP